MRWSRLFVPTLREVPAEAEAASHQLLLRAGFIRQLGAGIYSYLPLARRTLLKIEQIIREEMGGIGAQEFYLPALHPAEVWKESGRWDEMGGNLFRFRDRGERELCLGMTHEEVFTTIARSEIRSYRDLPQIWYQIQVKFRDEPRPKSGLLRTRQFTMKDSYSFDLDQQGLDASYQLHHRAYCSIFDRCGLRYRVVEAESGAMGGSESEEFMVESEAGEDVIVTCACGYAANLERATSRISPVEDGEVAGPPEEVHTPGQKTIQEVSDFLKVSTRGQIKSLVYRVEDQLRLVLLRGDHQLSESRLSRVLGTEILRPATAAEIREAFGADPGSLGPVGIGDLPILADQALEGRRNLVCGANRDDYHLRGVTPGRDFQTRLLSDPAAGRIRRSLPSLWSASAGGQDSRGRTCFQAGTQVQQVHGGHGVDTAGKQPPHRHGQLRHWSGEDHGGGGGALPRQQGNGLAPEHRPLRGGDHRGAP